MKRDIKRQLQAIHKTLTDEYGQDFELAIAPGRLFFTTNTKGKEEDIDVKMPEWKED